MSDQHVDLRSSQLSDQNSKYFGLNKGGKALAWTFLDLVGPLMIGEFLLNNISIQKLSNFRVIKQGQILKASCNFTPND